jgi:small subunit ribosomal protein S27Ae
MHIVLNNKTLVFILFIMENIMTNRSLLEMFGIFHFDILSSLFIAVDMYFKVSSNNTKSLLSKSIYNIFILRGGGKKRKKKNYTKPKKNKHIKKKVKLRYLNYYSIVSGEIKKLRKNSPESPGCFMAEHHDRITCGKTGLTYTR